MNFGKLKMYVGGELIDSVNKSEKTILCTENNETITELSCADKYDAEKALKDAKSGYGSWTKLKHKRRKEIVFQKLSKTNIKMMCCFQN